VPELHLGDVGSMFSARARGNRARARCKPYVAQVKVHRERASAAFGLTGAVLERTGAALRLHRGSPPSEPELHVGDVGSMFSARARGNRALARCIHNGYRIHRGSWATTGPGGGPK
jgi:hypothetical protein